MRGERIADERTPPEPGSRVSVAPGRARSPGDSRISPSPPENRPESAHFLNGTAERDGRSVPATRRGLTTMSVKRNVLRVAATTVASGLLAAGALATAGSASAATYPVYSFHTLDNARDFTFNQLLGIND